MKRLHLSLLSCAVLLLGQTTHVLGQSPEISSALSNHNGYAVSCFGESDASIDLTITGGTSPYSFLWSTNNGTAAADGATTEDLSNLGIGTYTVVVTDAVSATSTVDITVTQPPALAVSLFSPDYNGYNVHCNAGADGQISSSVSGGVSPYSYSWSTGATVPDIGSLGAGYYQVQVTGANGCSLSADITLTEPAAVSGSLSVSSPIACSGGTTDVNLSVSGGVSPYIFNWSTTMGSPQASGAISQNLNAVTAGDYTVRIEDANGCIQFESMDVVEPDALTIGGSLYEYQPGENFSCPTCDDGQGTIVPSGGTPPYTYLWTSSTGSWQGEGTTTATATNLAQGATYNFTVTDAAGCTANGQFTMPTMTPPPSTLELFGTMSSYAGGYQVSSNGASDGSIDLQVMGGTSPYTYLWNTNNGSPGAVGATTQDLDNLAAGTYSVTVTDANQNTAEKSFTLNAPANVLSAYLNTMGVGCNGQTNGQLSAVAMGGTPPYTYLWSTSDGSPQAVGAISASLQDLGPGLYSVDVTDAVNAVVTLSYQMNEPDAIGTSITPSFDQNGYQMQCGNGGSTALDLNVSGGTPPYTYLWDNGKFTEDINVTAGGDYNVQVEDGKGCVHYDGITVNAPAPLQPDASWLTYPNGQLFSCETCDDAELTMSVTGGVAPVTFTLTSSYGSQTGPVFTGIHADTEYSLEMVDALGCTISLTGAQAIVVPRAGFSSLQVSATLSSYPGGYNVSTFGGSDGSIDLNISGQMSQVTIAWTDGPTDSYRSGLTAGTYEVTVSDNAGQSMTKSWTLTQPQSGMSVMINGQYSSCMGSGSLNAMVNGGTPPYMYQWTGPSGVLSDTWSSISVYETGTFDLLVTDANNSTAMAQMELTMGTAVQASVSSPEIYPGANASCSGGDGSLVIDLSDGVPPYNLDIHGTDGSASNANTSGTEIFHTLMSTSDPQVTITGLSAGTYSVKVTDMSGCGSANESIELLAPPAVKVDVVPTTYPNGFYFSCETCSDGSITAAALTGSGPYAYQWVELPSDNILVKVDGASLYFDDIKKVANLGSNPSLTILSTTAQLTNAAPATWYAVMATDQLGCSGGKAFSLEKPSEGNLSVDSLRTRYIRTERITSYNPGDSLLFFGDSSVVINHVNEHIYAAPRSLGYRPLQIQCQSSIYPGGGNNNTILNSQLGKVGIRTSNPAATLDVHGQISSYFASINTLDMPAKLTVKASANTSAMEVQDAQGAAAIIAQSDGKIVVGTGNFNQTNNRASIYLGNGTDHIISAIYGKGLSLSTYGVQDAVIVEQVSGKVGIGVGINHTFGEGLLEVKGTIRSTRVVVELTGWSDFVFDEGYQLRSLDEVEQYINEHGHLPDVPSAEDVCEQGQDLGQMDAILLRKIEELTLYIIELENRLQKIGLNEIDN